MSLSARAGPPALAALAAAIAYLPFLGDEGHWGSREPRHAEIAREMTVSGEWLVPRLCGQVYRDKPPLLHWLAALGYIGMGEPSMFAARLPSALAGIAAALAVYGIATTLATRRAALLAALTFAATPAVAAMARRARPDMLLCALVLLACFAAARAAAARGRAGARAFVLLFGAAAGAATLAKGPLGLLLPLIFALALRRGSEERSPFASAGALATAVAGFAVAILAWAVPTLLHPEGPAYVRAMLGQPDLTTGMEKHARPFYYYLGPLAGGFLPYTLALAPAVADAWRERARGRGGVALVAAAAILVLLSLVPGKRWHYLLPVFPFLAIAVAVALDRRFERPGWRAAWIGATIALLVGTPLAARFVVPRFDPNEERALAARVNGAVPAGEPIVSLFANGEEVAWFGRRAVEVASSAEDAARRLGRRERAFLLVKSHHLDDVDARLEGGSLAVVHRDAPVVVARFERP